MFSFHTSGNLWEPWLACSPESHQANETQMHKVQSLYMAVFPQEDNFE